MEKKTLLELSERFRKGLLNRRDFIQKIILSAGGVAAASQILSQLGFDEGFIKEVKAQDGNQDIETMDVEFPSNDGKVEGYLAKPVGNGPFRTMIVIHEIFCLSEFTKDVARLFARNGYLALAPRLPEGCPMAEGERPQWMLDTMRTGEVMIPQNEQDKLRGAFEWLGQRSDVDPDHIASVGFCWGGARSFTLATKIPELWAAIVFYGSTPPFKDLPNIQAPVLGLYGALDNGNPNSITGRAAETAREMARLEKTFEWEVYNQAPHGFFADRVNDRVAETRPALIARDLLFDFLDRHYNKS